METYENKVKRYQTVDVILYESSEINLFNMLNQITRLLVHENHYYKTQTPYERVLLQNDFYFI